MPETKPVHLPPLPGRFSFYRLFVRPLLFRLNPETVHDFMISVGRLLQLLPSGPRLLRRNRTTGVKPNPLRLSVAGLNLLNPIGLAAGFDKNAQILPVLERVGFGFLEVGTITPKPQLGNPRPRLMRYPERRAILNRMGFNNDGVDTVALNLKRYKKLLTVPLGVNIGKNRDTPNSEAVNDYERLLKALQFGADYFTVNISSPNTPGLRDLQSSHFVQALGDRILKLRREVGLSRPIFLKLSPDLGSAELKAICMFCGPGKPFTGLVLTNTLPTDLGGLSGYPLKGPSTAALKAARALLDATAPIISVGGIETAADVLERIELGADAVQIYSTLIYQGPRAVLRIQHDLQKMLKRRGADKLADLRRL